MAEAMGKKGRPTPQVFVTPNQGETLLFIGWEGVSPSPASPLVSSTNVPYRGLSRGLRGWQLECPAAAQANVAVKRESLCCWARVAPGLLFWMLHL